MIPKTWLMSFSYKKGSHIVQRVRNYATKPRLKFDKQDLKGRKIGAGEYALLVRNFHLFDILHIKISF